MDMVTMKTKAIDILIIIALLLIVVWGVFVIYG